MTYKSLTESVELYKDGESLAAAAAHDGVSTDELASALRSQGIELREETEAAGTTTRY
jgi:lambda repressor-like predicted transcriptional regulator